MGEYKTILAGVGKILPVHIAILSFGGHGDVALGLGVGDLDLVGQQKLGEQPGRQYLLGVLLIEHAQAGSLGDHGGVFRVELGDHPHLGLKLHQLFLGDIHQGGI